VQYERRPLFCHHCYVIGHNVVNCKRLNPEVVKVPDHGKKKVTDAASNPPRVGNGASSSGTLCYVPVVPLPTDAPSTEKHVDVPTPTSDAYAPVTPPTAETRAAVPPPAAAIPNNNAIFVIPQPSAAAGDAAGTTCSNLQDFFEHIPQGNLPRPNIPVLEIAKFVVNDDVQLSSETLPVNKNNFSVEHGEEHDDDDDDDVDFFIDEDSTATAASKNTTASIPLDLATVQMPTQATPLSVPEVISGSRPSLASPVVVKRSLEASASMTIPEAQKVVVLQQQHVHPSKNIQHGLDLWDRVRDERSAAEDFTPVLTRKQKQKIKLQQVLAK